MNKIVINYWIKGIAQVVRADVAILYYVLAFAVFRTFNHRYQASDAGKLYASGVFII